MTSSSPSLALGCAFVLIACGSESTVNDGNPNRDGAVIVTDDGVLAPTRRAPWAPGVPGGIPERTTVCATLEPGATAGDINAAIEACPAGQVVMLAAGTYDLDGGIDFTDIDNVTLRGAGPDQTFVTFTDSVPCGGQGANVCFMNGHNNHVESPGNVADWTAGHAQGATVITLSSTTNLQVGSLVILDQLNDADTDNGEIWVCESDNVCSDEGGRAAREDRAQTQIVTVTNISGDQITVTPPIYMPNWRSSQAPQAWWSNDLPISGSGIEDLSLDFSGDGGPRTGIKFANASSCWAKNIVSKKANRSHVLFYQAANNTVADGYFYDSKTHASQSYGWETFIASDNLVVNNIMHHVSAPMMNTGASGDVFAYNYTFDDYYVVSASWMQASSYHHAGGCNMILHEGNEGTGFTADGVHGTQQFLTGFRNRWHGWEPGKDTQTVAVNVYAYNRYLNFVGNVLGREGYHDNYQWNVAGDFGETSIYRFGKSPGSGVPADPLSLPTILRWGNYDTFTGTARFEADEVPSTSASYPNPVPETQTIPGSLYLTAVPSFWPDDIPFPAIGPDVTGGVDASGHVHAIPARRCYEMSAKDANGMLTAFNARTCYAGY